ncbi:hypothetical protein, partial [Escherichia coli]|uniref:hypothetical protein n=1 Tax=Escherichia coli TaxID=562 RepID=UPI0021BF720F
MLKAPDFGRLGRFEIVLAQRQFHTMAVKKFAWYLRTHYVFRIAPPYRCPREGANKQVISSQADSLIKISRIWADFFPANTSNQPI